MHLILLLVVLAALPCTADGVIKLSNSTSTLVFDSTGSVVDLSSKATGRSLLAAGQPAPILQLRVNGQWHSPDHAAWDSKAGRLTLSYAKAGTRVVLSVIAKDTHFALELLEAEPVSPIEVVVWGPYPTVIGETIGEIVGVVRDPLDAVGIQALNAKTLGGSPHQENDIDVEFGADDTGRYPNLPVDLQKGQGFRGDTARQTPFGSILQAYSRNRSQERVIPNWGHPRYRVPPFADGGVIGSRIALFTCPRPRALATIGAIEVAEGLPHPMLDGVWAKASPGASASYLIVDFGESTVDRAIEMTRRAGLRYLYHSSPFSSWGHFGLKPSLFPNGWDGFRVCVEKAHRAGVELGIHTLSNFITPSDAYVTPVPDPRLSVIGFSELVVEADAKASELVIADPGFFSGKSALNAVRIGDELVRFESVSRAAPWRLEGCQRGAWGTRAVPHSRGAPVGRLLDHDYKVFFGDASLSQEMARRIAAFFNHTGARQLSFDGLEGNWSTGLGQYGRTLFTKAWYDALDGNTRGTVINDASNPGHFNWHINTRMNWGEPWYAGFRESQTLYRFKNQVLFERNLMPHMLGWFALRSNTSLEDAEWLLARAAGFDAGFALATSLASTAQLAADPTSADTARQFGATTAILASISQWETARMAGAFTPEMKARLRDNQREFHLSPEGSGRWKLQEAFVGRFSHGIQKSGSTRFEFMNPAPAQPLQWIVRSESKSPVSNIQLHVGGRPVFDLGDVILPPGGSIRYPGGSEAILCDAAWKEIGRRSVDAAAGRISGGPVEVRADGLLPDGAALKIELRTLGPGNALQKGWSRGRDRR